MEVLLVQYCHDCFAETRTVHRPDRLLKARSPAADRPMVEREPTAVSGRQIQSAERQRQNVFLLARIAPPTARRSKPRPHSATVPATALTGTRPRPAGYSPVAGVVVLPRIRSLARHEVKDGMSIPALESNTVRVLLRVLPLCHGYRQRGLTTSMRSDG